MEQTTGMQAKTPNNGPIAILFVSLVIVMLGFGIVVPILPYYVTHFGVGGQALGWLMAIYSIMQFIFAPVWGKLSDRVGRKPVFLIGLAGYALSFGLMGLSHDYTQLFLSRALAGILSSATLPTALAFIADTTTADNRSRGMGLLGAAMGLGMIFGPLLGGTLTGVILPPAFNGVMQYATNPATGVTLNLSLPFYVASLLALITIPFVILKLPESLPKELRVDHRGVGGPSRLKLLKDALTGPMGFLFIMAFLLAFALTCYESVLGLYAYDRYGLGPSQVGMLLGLIGILSVIQQGVVIGPLTRKIGEERVLRWGLIISLSGFLGLAILPGVGMLVLFSAVFNIGNSLLRPSVASLISQRAEGGQGVAMGLENSFMSLGRVFGPLWAGTSYDISMTLPFWSGAFFQAIALAISFVYLKIPKIETQTPAQPDTLAITSE
jgi:MFS transporter, DHA1 family, multidrug resistance protein